MPVSAGSHFIDFIPMMFTGIIFLAVGILFLGVMISIIIFAYIKNETKYRCRCEELAKKNQLKPKSKDGIIDCLKEDYKAHKDMKL